MWERILGIGKSTRTFITGKVGIGNIKELSSSQIATSRFIGMHLQKERDVCRQIEDNTTQCLSLLSHYDRDIAAGAIFEQIDLIKDDFQRLMNAIAANLAVLNIFKVGLNNLRKAIQKRKEITTEIRQFLANRNNFAQAFQNLRSQNIKITKDFAQVLDRVTLQSMSSQSQQLETKMTDLAQRIQNLEATIGSYKDARSQISVIDAMANDIQGIMDQLSAFGSIAMTPRLNPARLSFRVTPDIQKMFGLLLQNQLLISDILAHQSFYMQKAAYVGIRMKDLAGPLKQSAGSIEHHLGNCLRAAA